MHADTWKDSEEETFSLRKMFSLRYKVYKKGIYKSFVSGEVTIGWMEEEFPV